MQNIKTKLQALEYLYQHIPVDKDYVFPGDFGLKRTKYLLSKLGDPQNNLRVIHLAGTSGKGSTAYLTSAILTGLGFNVGLSLSPHLLDIRERFQINNQLIDDRVFIHYLNEILPAIEKTTKSEYGTPTYFEILVALAYYLFYKESVDYAVMETGMGGLFDGTNVVNSKDKICVITKIGHDHTKVLGKTLAKIAYQKAGIIGPNNPVITTHQNPKAMKVISRVCLKQWSNLYLIDRKNIRHAHLTPCPFFDFEFLNESIKDIGLKMPGSFQIQNASLALAVSIYLSQRDNFFFDKSKVKYSLKNASFLGRMQEVDFKKAWLVLDGAHNPQKMRELTRSLKIYYPNKKFTFLIGFKKGKDYKKMLRYLTPIANKIIITSFFNQTKSQGISVIAEDPSVIAEILSEMNFNKILICKNTADALKVLALAKKDIGVVTGSLYLLSEIYPLLYKEVAKITG